MRRTFLWTSIPFQLAAIAYLLGFIAVQLSSPTTASFHDAVELEGRISAASEFNEDQEDRNQQEQQDRDDSESVQ